MKIHQLTVDEALASLHTSGDGLSSAEALRRLREYGPNRIEAVRRKPLVLRLLKELTQLFSLVLWLAAALSFALEHLSPGQGMARLGIALIAVIVTSGLFSFWQEFRVERALAAMRELLPNEVAVVRDGHLTRVPAAQLVPGDVVVLEQGASVPADCRLIEAFAVRVNNATVTGESSPQPRDSSPSTQDSPAQSNNVLLAGTSVVAGRGKSIVFATGMNTEFGRIAHLSQAGGEEISPLRRQMAHLSRVIIALAATIGSVFFMLGLLLGVPIWEDFIFTIGIIVAMVPEGLLPTLTLALVLTTQRMAKRKVLIRHLPAVEALGSTTVICTDKTGTLTENRMRATALVLGATDVCLTVREAAPLVEPYRPLFLAAALCNDLTPRAKGDAGSWFGDPMEIALAELARQVAGEPPDWSRVDEIPFDTERMRMSVTVAAPDGDLLVCKGAPESVIPLCTRALSDMGKQALSPSMRSAVGHAQEAMTDRGLRVLALAYRSPACAPTGGATEEELVFAGLVGLEDPVRPEVPAAIEACHRAGVKVIMVTGDHPHTALAVAREIGLARSPQARTISGEQLHRLSDTQLQLALDGQELVFSRVRADQKMRIVNALKRKGHIVAVTGDGVNDAPALKSAHVGIAIGSGTDVAKEAADMVLLDDNFATIVSGIEEGRAVFDNTRKFLTYILAHNVPELVPYLAFALFRIPLALTPIQVLAVDMGTDSLTGLGLGVEPPEPDVMARPPRPPQERLLDWRLALRAYVFLGLFEAAAAMAAFLFLLRAAGWSYGQPLESQDPLYLQATTACLGTIVLLQIVNVFLCRSPSRSLRSMGLGGNPIILWGIVVELASLLLICYTTPGNEFFGTAPLPPDTWLGLMPLGAGLLVLEEARKYLAGKWLRSR